MNILIAPDKFKGSCTALEVGENLKKGIKSIFQEANCQIVPLADGGEGTLEALASSLRANWNIMPTQDPLGRKISASYLIEPTSNKAIIEMARASGFELLLDSERNCMKSSSYGTGLQIVDAIQKGARQIVLTVGGTATNDAGIGIAAALGFTFLDENKQPLKPIGENLIRIKYIDNTQSILKDNECTIIIATDVENQFFGENGATKVFARQKGANDEEIEILDAGLRNFNEILVHSGYPSVEKVAGSGAGGGVAGGLNALFGAKIYSAADWILEINKVEEKLETSQILITGEGKVDSQTWGGKLISRILRIAERKPVPVIVVCGTLEDINQIPTNSTICHISSIIHSPMTLEEAMTNSAQLLVNHGMLIGHYLSKK